VRRRCLLDNQGLVPYAVAWEQQRSLVAQRIQDPTVDDVLLLLEHPPVYTLGQGASLEFLKFDPNEVNTQLYRIERGGFVSPEILSVSLAAGSINTSAMR